MLLFKFKSQPQKVIKYSYVGLTTFTILLSAVILGLYAYFSSFSKDKWQGNIENRYCMISDIESNYSIIGKNKEYIIDLLGSDYIEDFDQSAIRYKIQSSLVSTNYYVLHYDNNIIVSTETTWID